MNDEFVEKKAVETKGRETEREKRKRDHSTLRGSALPSGHTAIRTWVLTL